MQQCIQLTGTNKSSASTKNKHERYKTVSQDVFIVSFESSSQEVRTKKISGDDAFRGNTRSHAEHDG